MYIEKKIAFIVTLLFAGGLLVAGMCPCAKEKKELPDQYLEKSKDCTIVIKCFVPWCPPCKEMGLVFQKVSEELNSQKCQFFSIDVDQHEAFVDTFNIKSIPIILILQNKEVKEQISGIYTVDELKTKVKTYIQP